MEILLIRHGETKWNRELVFRGKCDIPLSEYGLKQAESLRKYLSTFKIDAIFSSPLVRAKQTVKLLSEYLGIEISPIEFLVDVDFGLWTGLSRDKVNEKYHTEFVKWSNNPLDMLFSNGDSVKNVQQRCYHWLEEAAKGDYERVIVVTHRVILKLLLLSILKAHENSFWKIQFDTCSISSLDANNGKFSINYLNNTHHLSALESAKLPDF